MKKIIITLFLVFNLTIITVGFAYAASHDMNETSQSQETQDKSKVEAETLAKMAKYIAASIAIAGATISSGIAIGRIGSAAMGAISEKPEASGSAMILAALAEGVCLWGIAGAFLILFF